MPESSWSPVRMVPLSIRLEGLDRPTSPSMMSPTPPAQGTTGVGTHGTFDVETIEKGDVDAAVDHLQPVGEHQTGAVRLAIEEYPNSDDEQRRDDHERVEETLWPGGHLENSG